MLFFVKGNKTHSLFLIRHCGLAVLLAHLLITFKLGGGREDKGQVVGLITRRNGFDSRLYTPLVEWIGEFGFK